MKAEWSLFCFILIFTQVSCGQNPKVDKLQFDQSKIAIIPFNEQNNFFAQFKNVQPASLSQLELTHIDKILNQTIEDYNTKDAYRGVIDLNGYKRQYMAVKNAQGEKQVWVNCFCRAWSTDWKTQLIMVADGGKCFFNLKINLSTNKAYALIINGEA